jgi:outer membrane protein TolC
MKPIAIALVVWLMSGIVAVGAQESNAVIRFSLKEAQDYAVKFSTDTLNSRIDVLLAQKKIRETTAGGLPQLTAKISYSDNLKIPTTLIPAKFLDPDAEEGEFIGVQFGTQHNATADLTVSQLVFNGSYIVALMASKVYLQLSQNQQEKKEIDIRETVAGTYHLILLAENNLSILESSVKNLRQTRDEAEAMYKAGFNEETDVDQLRLAVTDLENTQSTTRRQIEMAYRMLKLQMGFDLDRFIELSDSLTAILSGIDKTEPQPVGFDPTRHIDYRMVETQERSLALMLKREKTELLPTVSAFFSFSQFALRNRFNFFSKGERWYPGVVLGLNLSVPVFTSGAQQAKVAQAQLELEKARNLKEQVTDGLKLAMSQARSDFSEALAREKSTAQSVILAQRILDRTRSKFGQGLATSMELTQAHNQYLNAESSHAQAVVELLDSRIRLDKALNQY